MRDDDAGAAPAEKAERPEGAPQENPVAPAPLPAPIALQPQPAVVTPLAPSARPSEPTARASVQADIDATTIPLLKAKTTREERQPRARDLSTTETPDANGWAPESELEDAAITEPQPFPYLSNEQRPRTAPANEPLSDLEGPALKTMNVIDLQTHLPTAIVNSLTQPIREPGQAEAPPESQHVEPPPPEQVRAPLRILKFGIEPAALGAIEVKMRVTHFRVEIEIAAENVSTSALLIDTRDALSAAIEQKGLSLQSYEVTLNAAPPSGGGERESGFRDEQRTYSGERGFANDDRPGQRQRHDAPQPDRRRRDSPSADPIPVGFIV